jgi:anhydro-N-acetylmuramic acid kinase
VDDVLLCGGGARNPVLRRMLQEAWGQEPAVKTLERVGWDSRALEAIAFAVLAYQAVRNVPANLPQVTGASKPVILGTIVPGNSAKISLRS